MNKIYIIYQIDIYENGYDLDSYSNPIIAYDDKDTAEKEVAKLNKDFDIQESYECLLKRGYNIEYIKDFYIEDGPFYVDELDFIVKK